MHLFLGKMKNVNLQLRGPADDPGPGGGGAFARREIFPFDRPIRHYEFSDMNRAIRDTKNGRTIKPVLRFSPQEPF